MYFFYFFAAIVVWLGLLSLRGGLRFAGYVRRETARPLPSFTPYASLIVPCRGLDENLRENLETLFRQDYPRYEIIFATDSADDLSLNVIEDLRRSHRERGHVHTRTVIAGSANDSGQKVHNLRAAVSEVDPRSEVLVFFDTDGLTQSNWLRSLVAPLHDEGIGAATGYRWFVPVSGLASHLRSVWNASIASALGERRESNFCWGGSTAIRRATFEGLGIRERWRGSVSDDFTMTRVLGEANLPIHFVPSCLVASFDTCSFGELLEFTNRQLKLTRVYASHLWRPVLIGSFVFNLVFFGGLALVFARIALGLSFAFPLALLCLVFLLGAAKAYIRFRAISIPLATYGARLEKGRWAQLLLWPIASALYLYNACASAFSRRIEWRGITYELKSPTEAVIISRR